MAILVQNALLLHLDPLDAAPGELRIENDRLTHVGVRVPSAPGDELIDARGCVVMPGLVNGHTHLYSALAVGMPPPPRRPKDFHEILQLIWWRLDRALDATSIQWSATIGALDALHAGTTTLIDHHASPNHIAGSLDALEEGIAAIGQRAVLCYETTDRHSLAGASQGLKENRRFATKCAGRSDHRVAAMIGAHAAFTMRDETLRSCTQLAESMGTGVHIHVAEDPCDDAICRKQYGAALVERLERCGVLLPDTILAHCIHLPPEDGRRLSGRVGAIAHNPRSNMNNQVGFAPIGSLSGVQLGTDGIGSDMLTEAKFAYFKARDAKEAVTPADIVTMLSQSARTASRRLGCILGKLEPGAASDIVITDYKPATPLDKNNIAGHLLFGLGPQYIRHVIIDGRWVLRDRVVRVMDEADIRIRAQRVAENMWRRMALL